MCSSFERLLMEENEQGEKRGRREGRKEGRREGRREGKIEDIIELLEELGELSDALRNQIMEQKDITVLSSWHKIAAKSASIEEFEESIGLVQLR